MTEVFVSHNSKDIAIAKKIANILRSRGFQPWLDQQQLDPGQAWIERMETALEKVSAMIVLIGGNGLGRWQLQEVQVGFQQYVERQMLLIPALLPGAAVEMKLSPFLSTIMWLDLRQGLNAQGLEALMRGLSNKSQPHLDSEQNQYVLTWNDIVEKRPAQSKQTIKVKQIESEDYVNFINVDSSNNDIDSGSSVQNIEVETIKTRGLQFVNKK